MGASEEGKAGEDARRIVRDILSDRIVARLLEWSNLTRAQFETILVDQLGEEMANRALKREEMVRLRQTKPGISRGAFNRTLHQARTNVSEAIHTVLVLGYSGMLESPSLAQFVEASERLRTQTSELKALASSNPSQYSEMVSLLLDDLENAFEALFGRR